MCYKFFNFFNLLFVYVNVIMYVIVLRKLVKIVINNYNLLVVWLNVKYEDIYN